MQTIMTCNFDSDVLNVRCNTEDWEIVCFKAKHIGEKKKNKENDQPPLENLDLPKLEPYHLWKSQNSQPPQPPLIFRKGGGGGWKNEIQLARDRSRTVFQ